MDGRLNMLYELAGSGAGVADIGCDHGYLVCALVESGRASFGLACDVNPLPLAKAAAEISRRGLGERVTTVLTDGLAGLSPEGLDRVVIAGMGGELISRILSERPAGFDSAVTLLLQPMTRAEELRVWFCEQGFSTVEERACVAAGRLYSVMKCRYTGERTRPDARRIYLGALDMQRDPLAPEYRRRLLERLSARVYGLSRSEEPDAQDKLRYYLGLIDTLRA